MAANTKSAADLSSTGKPEADSLVRGEKLKMLYETMLQCRALEARARLLSRNGRFPFPSARASGQEAVEVGCTIDLRAEDRVVAAERDFIFKLIQDLPLGTPISHLGARAIDGEEIDALLALSGKTAGSSLRAHGPFGIGARLALANRSKKKNGVVVAFTHGHSASLFSSLVSWDEALALAGARFLPILFVVQHVLQGGSARSEERAKTEDPSRQAERHGFPGIPVDGNDVVAVYRVAHESLKRARRGGGPTLIECKPCFYDGIAKHRRGQKSRSQESADGQGDDPIQYMEEYLSRKGLFSEAWKNQVAGAFARELDEIFERAGSTTSH